MRQSLSIFLLLASINAIAGHRYVSSSAGNDGNNGLDSNHAYKSLTKVNAIYPTLSAGDTIYFKRGDTFLGRFAPMRSGLSGLPMVITAYGAGEKPIISGLITLHTWTQIGSTNVWQCTPDSVLKANTNVLTFNGIPQAVGRTDWLHYSSATTTQLTSSTALPTSPSYVGAEVVIRKKVYIFEKATVTAQSGNVLTYSNANQQPIHNNRTAAGQPGQTGYGFFLQRFAGSLDQQGEWYFDKTANKVKIYSTTNPNSATIKISFKDTLILLDARGYTTISNIAVEGASVYGVESFGGTSVTVSNCEFRNNTLSIYMWNTTDAKAEYNNIENSLNSAIVISNTARKRLDINYNYIHNTSPLIGNAIFNVPDNMFCGILARTDTTRAQNYVNVIGNKVINTGHCPIYFQGMNATVRRNVIDTFAYQQDDMGGIYTFINNQSTNTDKLYVNRIIDSNFVSNAIGAPLGKTTSGGIDVAGLYFDDQSCNMIIRYNTVWNIPGNGIQLNNPLNVTVQYNTVYNCSWTINENRKEFGVISGVLISNNVLYQKSTSQYNFYTVTNSLTQPSSLTNTTAITQLGTIDSNWINDIKSSGNGYRRIIANSPAEFGLSAWKLTYGKEIHSTLPPITTTSSNTRLVTNASDNVIDSGFIGFRKITAKGVVYDNYIRLPKWTSAVLIDNGTANIAPVANAGADKVITLPTSSVTFTGSGTDADGTVSSYAWARVSGPNTGSFGTPSSATTTYTGLIAGVYQVRLTVTDNGGATNSDTVLVTVIGNQAPSADAGANQTITLPKDSTAVAGVGTDIDGTVTYLWSRISGPNTPTMPTPTATGTGINGMVQGVYQYEFKVTDNGGLIARDTIQITVNAAVNQVPHAQAPTNFSITLPTSSTTLDGSASTDADGTISSYTWSFISGPTTPVITTPASVSTLVSGLSQGVYRLRLTVVDNSGGSDFDNIDITVNSAANMTPTSLPGSDRTITLPQDTVHLTGSGTDPDGSITAYGWTKISGGGTIVSPTAPNTTVTGLTLGANVFELMVTDNYTPTAGTATAQVTITVLSNPAPIANAGSDIQIQLPTTTTTLSGSGTDDVSISSYAWVKISGPTGGTISNAAIASPGLSALQYGVYQYELTVTDNGGSTGKDTVSVTVILADNLLPHANASIDRAVNPPTDTITIFGSGTDTDGTIANYAWVKILGPVAVIESPTSATTVISSLISATYQFELTVTDDRGGVSKDTMQVIVNSQPFNIPPTADAGPDRQITAPQDSITLFGRGADVDGTITYYWSGTGGIFVDRTVANPLITGLAPGTYTFALTVRDDGNLTAVDYVTVIVYPAQRQKRVLLGIYIPPKP